ERRSQHREPAQCAGVAPGHVTSCDRHDSSFALLRLLGIGILHAYRTARERLTWFVCFVPCVYGSELARVFFTFAGWSVQPCVRPVSAAHRPLAIMPSADQVPVKSSHLTMHWHMWVVLIAGIDRLCITCCSPSQPSHRARSRRDSFHAASATGSL